ncbi:FliA/WhiG family RNA polymerase sigma factor [bacterium]|nr:FliA/WhiG family RNA polymerase sigma factor [bacterium]
MDAQMVRLWQRLRRNGDGAARNELILAHLPLVRFVLGRLPVSPPSGLSHDDLLGAGVVALLRAVDDFDLGRGLEFATFAVPRIRGAILDELRAHDVLPRSARERAAQVDRAVMECQLEGRSAPSDRQVAQRAGLTEPQVRSTMRAMALRHSLSLDSYCQTSRPGKDQKIHEAATDRHTPCPLTSAMSRERSAFLAQAIAELPEAERRVIVLHYQHELMFKEIAEVLSVTRSRVSQIHSRALAHLHARITASAPAASSEPLARQASPGACSTC